ncbi:unnamed protein product [Arabidopsis lyrata]|nr:unnamed protein product [Arabidopsis lyrata]
MEQYNLCVEEAHRNNLLVGAHMVQTTSTNQESSSRLQITIIHKIA